MGKSRQVNLSLHLFLCRALCVEYSLKQNVLAKKLKTELFSTLDLCMSEYNKAVIVGLFIKLFEHILSN